MRELRRLSRLSFAHIGQIGRRPWYQKRTGQVVDIAIDGLVIQPKALSQSQRVPHLTVHLRLDSCFARTPSCPSALSHSNGGTFVSGLKSIYSFVPLVTEASMQERAKIRRGKRCPLFPSQVRGRAFQLHEFLLFWVKIPMRKMGVPTNRL
jgi:hypothetical protein